MTVLRLRPAAALLLPALLVLAGCASAAPAETRAPEPTEPSSSATPEPELDPAPTPAVDLGCDDLASTAVLQELLGAGAAPLAAVDLRAAGEPDSFAIEELGGLRCRWDNGLVGSTWAGPPEGRQSVVIDVLPGAEEPARTYAETYLAAEPGASPYGDGIFGPRCVGVEAPLSGGHCSIDGWVGSSWLALTVDGIGTDRFASDGELLTAFRTIADPLVASLDGATARPNEWRPPTGARTNVAGCETVIDTETARAATGIDLGWAGRGGDGPRISQYWYGLESGLAERCQLGLQSEATAGVIRLLAGGSWAFRERTEGWIADGAAVHDGVGDGIAYERCTDEAEACTVDLLVDGVWVRVELDAVPDDSVTYLPDGFPAELAGARDRIMDLVGTVVERMDSTA